MLRLPFPVSCSAGPGRHGATASGQDWPQTERQVSWLAAHGAGASPSRVAPVACEASAGRLQLRAQRRTWGFPRTGFPILPPLSLADEAFIAILV